MANWPIDPGKQIQWAKQPEYTARLLSLVASLNHRADQHCVFTPKGTGKGRIIADITDRLFCTLPYDHDRVEKQRASVQRRINQIGSNYQSDIRALQYDPYRVQPVLDNIRVYNPHWDLIRSILHDHPDFPHWDPDEPDQFLQEQDEQDDRLGRAQMQDVDYHPIASGSGLYQQQQPPPPPPRGPAQSLLAHVPAPGDSHRRDNYHARLADHTDANAVAGPSNPRPIPSYKYPAAAGGPIASGSGSGSASASGAGSGSGARPNGALKRPRSPSGNRSPSPQRRYVPGPANPNADVAARERQLAAREQAVIDGYKRVGFGHIKLAAAAAAQQPEAGFSPGAALAAREAAIEERERELEEVIEEIAQFDAYQELQRQAEVVQPPAAPAPAPPVAPAPPAAAAAAAPAPVQPPAPPPPPAAAHPAPANANANVPPDPNANANDNQGPNHAAAVAAQVDADDDEPPLAECPKCSFPLSAVPAADAESHLRACLDSEGASLAECPVCEASLSGMESAAERERHVDACCRGLGGTTTAVGGLAGDESAGLGGRAALAAARGSGGETKRQKREHVVFVSDEKTIPKDEKTGEPLECIMCFDEFEAEQRLARLSCYCLYHEECIVSYWENPSKFCPTHRELDTAPEVQMRAI
ncbi:hypothetical protein C6P46_001326 [Rhodotorula mucilaginosa]|uniref:RING-type E3 ubiquitin transferase n=1 Tax=Rhodotorula mucilaginosa TaxID=5537 RepID=A0A9P6VVD6_RHOMI|nr:hypothetical protein C6P46_001326 [Rhodotorula mucilaginosa]